MWVQALKGEVIGFQEGELNCKFYRKYERKNVIPSGKEGFSEGTVQHPRLYNDQMWLHKREGTNTLV